MKLSGNENGQPFVLPECKIRQWDTAVKHMHMSVTAMNRDLGSKMHVLEVNTDFM